MKNILIFLLLFPMVILAQVLPGVPVAGIPSGTTAQINAIPTPIESLMAYSTDEDIIYYYNGTSWIPISDAQTLSLSGSTLSISNGNSVTLPNASNIYNADGTLTGSRTLSGGGNSLTFNGLNSLQLFSTNNTQIFSTNAMQIRSTASTLQMSGLSSVELESNTNVSGNLSVTGSFEDSSGDVGGVNQVLTSTITGTNWVDGSSFDTDDQVASEVNSDTPVDVDGDGATEATVEDVIQDIAPIISKAARIFYPPSIAIDASTTGNNRTVDLYQEYLTQFGTPTARSNGAPNAVPTYLRNELYYYVTFADPAVFGPPANISIGGTGDGINEGVMTYNIIATPPDFNTLINVVFVVK